MNDRRSLFAHTFALAILIVAIFFVTYKAHSIDEGPTLPLPPLLASTTASASSTPSIVATTTITTSTASTTAAVSKATTTPKVKKTSVIATKSAPTIATSSPNDILRVENPYSTPPLTFEAINTSARAALVNILCSTRSSGMLKPISGSGVMIDSKGIVLTNAHVAQYVLIAQSGRTDLTCEVRTGAPAASKWIPAVIYIPTVWISEHAADIVQSHPLGTGEHDYALLAMTATVDESPLPTSYSAVSPDSREAIAFVDDFALAASYPVEFLGGGTISGNLYPVTSIASIRQLLTFSVGSADVLSLGGLIGAQSGSSGGAVLNQWGHIVGLITTTSEGATTADRDLHAITTGYINRDIKKQSGKSLQDTLSDDPRVSADKFKPEADTLSQRLIDAISGK